MINESLKVIAEDKVAFDQDLKEYRTHHGFHEGPNGRVTTPTIMWVKALDLLMERIRIQGVDMSQIVALSGAGQQHGSVYWRTGAGEMLKNLRPDKFMHDELAHAFSILDSPIWMDSSTTKQCKNLEESLGGPEALAKLTGSKAYERFTGKLAFNEILSTNGRSPRLFNIIALRDLYKKKSSSLNSITI